MITICEKHDEIRKCCEQSFYRGRIKDMDNDKLIDIIYDMERELSTIVDLVSEAKSMWQNMEDALRARKDFMIQKWIEEEYKS